MFLNLLLLLFCFISHCGTSPIPVTGKIGSSVTLPCEFEAKDISHIDLNTWSKTIPVCQNEECESENDRVFKKGSCDVIIKDLRLSDAGKYFLRVYYYNDQREVERQILEYHLHIHGEISVKTGEQLKMDVLLINADKVEKNSSGEWTEVWTRGHGVSSDQLNTGTYRVLDSEGEIWITVTVTESSRGSKGKLDNTNDHKHEQTVENLIWPVVVSSVVSVVSVALIIFAVRKCRNVKHNSYQQTSVQEPLHKSNNGHL